MKITSPPVQVLERDTLLFKKLENGKIFRKKAFSPFFKA